jgi:hypothetical protein
MSKHFLLNPLATDIDPPNVEQQNFLPFHSLILSV